MSQLPGAPADRRRRRRSGTRGEGARRPARSAEELARRRASVPAITYPDQLPVSARRDDIAAAIRDHQVVIVSGETGSGKTTQLPKILLELGRGIDAMIAHTQPRRIAARSVAERIAEELGVELGGVVGYTVRFTERAGEDTLVRLMTDGILLAEIQRDRELRRYDTIVIDEAHERSLNIDFLLGYLHQLLPRRPDLKVVITSATIDAERFSRHFGDAPVVEVSGRTFPVELRHHPLELDDEGEPQDVMTAIGDAVLELALEGDGDVLVFLSGEREIRDAAEAVAALDLPRTEVLPLYARLSAAEQHRVFAAHTGRRVVLATNVAETSLTVPGIRYVVDPGTARISRYSQRLKVQRLPIEPVSQASARQRAGRCGRVAEGICIRLYSEDDFDSRPEFTEPEILRTSLASVILQMTALGLGDVASFPFVEPPDARQIRDGVQLLTELGALEDDANGRPRLTRLGRSLARLPLDPRLGRMLLAADRGGCLPEVLVIAAALSIQDPRERPLDQQQAADLHHARFADPTSDFLSLLNLWDYLQERQDALSSSRFRRLCRDEHLHFLRIREWQDLVSQLRRAVRDLGSDVPTAHGRTEHTRAPADQVHRAVLAGLLSHVGVRDPEKRDYLGARGARFGVFPGSALFRKQPQWVMAAELVETSRLWGRTVAKIEPAWVEPLAAHLVKRQHSEPHWERKRAAAVAVERVTLYGLPLVVGRKVDLGGLDAPLARELFLRHALVEGDWEEHHEFLRTNRALLAEVEQVEHRLRRRDVRVDDEVLVGFYDSRVPPDVLSGRHFDRWWKQARRETPDLLTFPRGLLLDPEAAAGLGRFPSAWELDGRLLPLSYRFEPGADDDGVTITLPLALLDRAATAGFDWSVPGLRVELVTALLRSLPKAIRRLFVPAADVARDLVASLPTQPGGSLVAVLAREMQRRSGVLVDAEDFDPARVPVHLVPVLRVVDADGRELAKDRDPLALRARLATQVRQAVSSAGHEWERSGLTSWSIGTLPETVQLTGADGVRVVGHPALVDEGSTVALRVLENRTVADAAMRRGTRRLLLLTLPSPVRALQGSMSNRTKLAVAHNPYGSVPRLLDDCLAATLDHLVAAAGGPARDAAAFERLRAAVGPALPDALRELVTAAGSVLAAATEIGRALDGASPALHATVTDLRDQLDHLVGPGFVSRVGRDGLGDLDRWLQGMRRRLDRAPDDPARDRRYLATVSQLHAEIEAADARGVLPPGRRRELDRMLQELRIALFAPPMRTAFPVSEQRIRRALTS